MLIKARRKRVSVSKMGQSFHGGGGVPMSKLFRFAPVAALTAILLAVSVAVPTEAATIKVTYSVPSASYAQGTIPCGEICVLYYSSVDGSGTTDGFSPNDPFRSGDFSFTLNPTNYSPQEPYRSKSGTGTLSVTWADSSTSSASLTYRAKDRKSWTLAGTFSSGYFSGQAFTGSISQPPDITQGGTVSAWISLPPNPI
jgi:hypothetical protein